MYNKYFSYMTKCYDDNFNGSPFKSITSINFNKDSSISLTLNGKKLFKFKPTKSYFILEIAEKYYEDLDSKNFDVLHDAKSIESENHFIKIFCEGEDERIFQIFEFILKNAPKYVEENYVPDYWYDCCSKYLDCSDNLKCMNLDI